MKRSQSAVLPLRNLIVSLLLDRDPQEDLISDEDLASVVETQDPSFRGEYHIQEALKRYGVQAFDVTHTIGSTSENDGYDVSLLFVRGDEAVTIDLDCPAYCDDESDASIEAVSELMSVTAVRSYLDARLSDYRQTVFKHFETIGQEWDKLTAKIGVAA